MKSKLIGPLFLILISIVFFHKFFFQNLIPIPSDIIVGMYYPWLDQKWGFETDVPVKNPLMSDIVSIIYQWRTLAIDSIKDGSFPFWNKFYFGGMPLFANFQNSLINITNIPFLIFNKVTTAWSWMIFLQLIFSLLASYFCFITFKFKKIPSIVGSLIFSFSMFTVVWLEYGIHTYVAAFLPLIILFAEKYRLTFQKKYLVFISIFIGLQIYGGYPQYAIYTLIFLSLFLLFFVRQKLLTKILSLFIFIGLGLGLALPLLVPGYELTRLSIHDIDITAQDQTMGFLPLQNLLSFPVVNFFGNPATYDYYGSGFFDNNSVFPGSIAIVAFLYFLFVFLNKKLDPNHKFFLITIILSFLIATKNPFSIFLKNSFGFIFSGNGVSTRIFILANFSFAFLTASFVNSIQKMKFKSILPIFLLPVWQLILLFTTKNSISSKNTIYSLVFSLGIVFTIISIILFKNKKIKKMFSFLIVAITIFELFYFSFKYLPFSKPEYLFPTTPSIKFLQNISGNFRISTPNTMPQNMWVPYKFSSIDGYDATMPKINYEYFSLNQSGNFSPTAQRALFVNNYKSNLYQNLSIKYIFSQGSGFDSKSPESKRFNTVFQEKSTSIQEDKQFLPKVRFIDNVLFIKDKYEFQQKYQNVDFSNTAFIYQDISGQIKDQKCSDPNSKIEIVQDEGNQIIFNSQNKCSKLVFISNSFFPGWKALVDGQRTEVYQTNHMFQSIFLPAGEHQITLFYYPNNFNLCLILCAFSAFVLLLIYLHESKK